MPGKWECARIFHYIEFPKTEEDLLEILRLQVQKPENPALSQKAIAVLQQLRTMRLSKQPGLSELIDWVSYLNMKNTPL